MSAKSKSRIVPSDSVALLDTTFSTKSINSAISVDVLEHIFHHYIYSAPASPPVVLSHVCQLWRDIIARSGRFWTFIDLSRPTLLEHCLSHSREAPLDVIWEGYSGTRQRTLNPISPIRPHARRFRSLTLRNIFWTDITSILRPSEDREFPMLQRVSICPVYSPYIRVDGSFLRFKAPLLQSLTIEFWNDINLTSVLNLLQSVPLLQHIKLAFVVLHDDIPRDGLVPRSDLRHIRDWDLVCNTGVQDFLHMVELSPVNFSILDDPTISLPRHTGENISRAAKAAGHNHLFIDALYYFSTCATSSPSVYRFTHQDGDVDFLSVFFSSYRTLVPWPSITRLELSTDISRSGPVPDEDWSTVAHIWIKIFFRTPNLQGIHLCGFGSPALDVFHALWASPPAPDGDDLHDDITHEEGICCPHLRAFTISSFTSKGKRPIYQPPCDEDVVSLIEMVKERHLAGKPLQNLRIDGCPELLGVVDELKKWVGDVEVTNMDQRVELVKNPPTE